MRPSTEALLRYPVFRNFGPAELSSVSRLLVMRELDPGEVLFEKGAAGSSMFFLDVGRVQVDVPTAPGQHKVLASLDPPALFGEMSLLNNEPRSARIMAIRPSVLWEMNRESLLTIAEEKHAAAFKIMVWSASELSNRLRDTNNKLIQIYAKPFQSIQELKAQLAAMNPGITSANFKLGDD